MKKIAAELLFIILSLVILLLLIISGRPGCSFSSTEEKAEIPAPELMFGLPVDSFNIIEGVVKQNQNLGFILGDFGVSMASVDQLVRASQGIFDLKKIKTGKNYYLFQKPDSTRRIMYLVYEKSPADYVVFSLADSISATLGEKEISLRPVSASGTIQSSLWNAIAGNNLHVDLAIKLEDIYAWTIDFFGLQQGDRFRVMYEEQYVDSQLIGIGPVYAAEFEHGGKSLVAIRFFQDKGFGYFSEEGENLRKAFLKAPLKFSRISSHFSGSRFHPILKIRRPHFGVDYAAPKGTPVFSIGDGTVIARAHQGGGAGNYVTVRHNAVYSTTYMHLSGFAAGIVQGAHVSQGQVLGFVGSSGLSTGPHLDFRVYRNGTPIDPLRLEAPPAEPVKEELRPSFNMIRDSLLLHLNSVPWQD